MQNRFEQEYSSLQLEIRKRDEIISQLQTRILELERPDLFCDGVIRARSDSPGGESTEHDASMEDDLVDDNDEHPFMRDSSVDTVLTARTRRRYSSPNSTVTDSTSFVHSNRRSWEEHSEEETLELQDLPRSITPQSLWKDEVAIDLESSDDDKVDAAMALPGSSSTIRSRRRTTSVGRFLASVTTRNTESFSDDEDEDEQMAALNATGHNNWEVAMLAQELEKRRRSSECSSPGS